MRFWRETKPAGCSSRNLQKTKRQSKYWKTVLKTPKSFAQKINQFLIQNPTSMSAATKKTYDELESENTSLKEEIKLLQEEIRDYHFIVRTLRERYEDRPPVLSGFDDEFEVTLGKPKME